MGWFGAPIRTELAIAVNFPITASATSQFSPR